MRIDQLAKWQNLVTADVKLEELLENLEFRAKVVSIFRDEMLSKVRKSHVEDVLRISNYYIDLLSTYKKSDPAERIEIQGNVYTFSKNRNHWESGQIIDLKNMSKSELLNEPQKLLAIFYIEDGLEYCQEEKNKIINPNSEREELFRLHFPWQEYLNFQGFFLHNLDKRKLAIMGVKTARAMKIMREQQKEMSGTYGQRLWYNLRKICGFQSKK
jgi:L-lysine 2,3-aminomutase